MRVLGIDPGERRIGIAVSDPAGHIAVPVLVYDRAGGRETLSELSAIARREEAKLIVVGLALSLDGTRGPQARRAERFGRALQAASRIPVVFWDERFSTQSAERLLREAGVSRRRHRSNLDAASAAVILQDYLDSNRPATGFELPGGSSSFVNTRLYPVSALMVSAAVLVVACLMMLALPSLVIGGAPAAGPAAGPTAAPITIDINQGDNANVIATRLQRAGVIQNTELFTELTGLEGLQNGLAAGQYQMTPAMPVTEVIARLHGGDTGAIRVTIPEGKRLEEVGALLEKAGVVSEQSFVDAAQNGNYSYDFLSGIPAGTSLEGFIFPDTYNFPQHNKAQDVVNLMLRDFEQRVTPDLRSAFQQEGLSVHDAVTLASIVEREAQVPEERPIIASVFLNRLRLGMPLQADPTVQFALASNAQSRSQFGLWKQELSPDDLTVSSSYNTYVVNGLPPGPIANPGLDSIEAVAHPANTNYLFFVAKDDGSHAFAATYAEHQANIAKYQH